jgi:hypothetical protein
MVRRYMKNRESTVMNRILAAAFAAALLPCGPASAASFTAATMADTEDGLSYGVSASFAPASNWSIGAAVEQSESDIDGADFSGTAVRLSTDVRVGAFTAGASARRWKDSSQVKSTTVIAELGWMAENGLFVSALLDDRNMRVEYTTTVLGVPREARIDFNGTGYGADLSWFGTDWNIGARYLDYDYGRSVDRVRAALESSSTQRFPLVDTLLGSIVTRAAGAPDQQFMATVGRRFGNSSLQGDWVIQRDALTHNKVKSVSANWGFGISAGLWIDATAGFSDSQSTDSMAFGGLALTWRNQATEE